MVSLAVLAEGPLHAYVLKKRMTMGLGAMVSVSEGSLYPLLRSLEEQGAIVSHTEPGEKGRPDRVVYSITDAGRAELAARLADPLHEGPLGQTDFYVRVACFGHLSSAERSALIRERQSRLRRELDILIGSKEMLVGYSGHLELADLRERQLRTELEWLAQLETTSDGTTKEVDL